MTGGRQHPDNPSAVPKRLASAGDLFVVSDDEMPEMDNLSEGTEETLPWSPPQDGVTVGGSQDSEELYPREILAPKFGDIFHEIPLTELDRPQEPAYGLSVPYFESIWLPRLFPERMIDLTPESRIIMPLDDTQFVQWEVTDPPGVSGIVGKEKRYFMPEDSMWSTYHVGVKVRDTSSMLSIVKSGMTKWKTHVGKKTSLTEDDHLILSVFHGRVHILLRTTDPRATWVKVGFAGWTRAFGEDPNAVFQNWFDVGDVTTGGLELAMYDDEDDSIERKHYVKVTLDGLEVHIVPWADGEEQAKKQASNIYNHLLLVHKFMTDTE